VLLATRWLVEPASSHADDSALHGSITARTATTATGAATAGLDLAGAGQA
jgi:hypothetical protein